MGGTHPSCPPLKWPLHICTPLWLTRYLLSIASYLQSGNLHFQILPVCIFMEAVSSDFLKYVLEHPTILQLNCGSFSCLIILDSSSLGSVKYPLHTSHMCVSLFIIIKYVIWKETWMCCVIQTPAQVLCNIKENLDVLYSHQPIHYSQVSIPLQHETPICKQVFPSSMIY